MSKNWPVLWYLIAAIIGNAIAWNLAIDCVSYIILGVFIYCVLTIPILLWAIWDTLGQ